MNYLNLSRKDLICATTLIVCLLLIGGVLRWLFPEKPINPEDIKDPLVKMFFTEPNRFLDEVMLPDCDCKSMTEHAERLVEEGKLHFSSKEIKQLKKENNRLKKKINELKDENFLRGKDMSRNVLDVQCIGKRKAWHRLGKRRRNIIIDIGMPRLRKIRNVISEEAGLPMPPICIEPFGYISGGKYRSMAAYTAPIPVGNSNEFVVFMPAATLIAIDDDVLLRQLLCHEFAHCFWWICQALQAEDSGKTGLNLLPKAVSEVERLEHIIQVDSQRLVNPEDWFGEWDTKHFLPEGNTEALNKLFDKIIEQWLKPDLPTKTPLLRWDNNGSWIFDDEIIEHVEKLKKKPPK